TLEGGAGTSGNRAEISASSSGQTLTVSVRGGATLTVGPSTQSSVFIGTGATGSGNLSTLNFTSTGNLTLTGGGAADASAAIGTGRNQASATSNITISAANVTLNDGAGEVARIGHSDTNNGPGNILVGATGNLA